MDWSVIVVGAISYWFSIKARILAIYEHLVVLTPTPRGIKLHI